MPLKDNWFSPCYGCHRLVRLFPFSLFLAFALSVLLIPIRTSRVLLSMISVDPRHALQGPFYRAPHIRISKAAATAFIVIQTLLFSRYYHANSKYIVPASCPSFSFFLYIMLPIMTHTDTYTKKKKKRAPCEK